MNKSRCNGPAMRAKRLASLLAFCLTSAMILHASAAQAGVDRCWVSLNPGGDPVTWVTPNNDYFFQDPVTFWLNSEGDPGSQGKYIVTYEMPSGYSLKNIQKFSFTVPNPSVSSPLIPAAGSSMTFKVKYETGTCVATLDVGSLPFLPQDTPMIIPDAGTVQSHVTVSSIGVIKKVRVALWIAHSYDGDLDIALIGPDGTTVDLSSDNGGSGDNYGVNCTQRVFLDDDAANLITNGGAPFSSTLYKPESPLSAFAGKTGADANGTWTLQIADDTAADTGELQGWTLWIDEQ